MLALLLNKTLGEFFSSPLIIISIIVLILGIALALVAKSLSVKITKKEFDKESKAYKNIVVIALITILVGILLLIVGTAILAGLF